MFPVTMLQSRYYASKSLTLVFIVSFVLMFCCCVFGGESRGIDSGGSVGMQSSLQTARQLTGCSQGQCEALGGYNCILKSKFLG